MKSEMKLKPIDAEGMLQTLSDIRKSIPFLKHDAPPPSDEGVMGLYGGGPLDPDDLEEFNYMAVQDALEAFTEELSTALDEKRAEALKIALNIYYTAEEMVKDPEHANLIPHVEAMRAAYLESYGVEIPKKK